MSKKLLANHPGAITLIAGLVTGLLIALIVAVASPGASPTKVRQAAQVATPATAAGSTPTPAPLNTATLPPDLVVIAAPPTTGATQPPTVAESSPLPSTAATPAAATQALAVYTPRGEGAAPTTNPLTPTSPPPPRAGVATQPLSGSIIFDGSAAQYQPAALFGADLGSWQTKDGAASFQPAPGSDDGDGIGQASSYPGDIAKQAAETSGLTVQAQLETRGADVGITLGDPQSLLILRLVPTSEGGATMALLDRFNDLAAATPITGMAGTTPRAFIGSHQLTLHITQGMLQASVDGADLGSVRTDIDASRLGLYAGGAGCRFSRLLVSATK